VPACSSDAFLDKKTVEQFDGCSTPRSSDFGLLEATKADPLEWICFFSSVAARGGNAGQADYAMANEILNKVAAVEALRRGKNCRVAAIGWGPWEGGMVTPALKKHFESMGVPLLPIAGGAKAFVSELSATGHNKW